MKNYLEKRLKIQQKIILTSNKYSKNRLNFFGSLFAKVIIESVKSTKQREALNQPSIYLIWHKYAIKALNQYVAAAQESAHKHRYTHYYYTKAKALCQ